MQQTNRTYKTHKTGRRITNQCILTHCKEALFKSESQLLFFHNNPHMPYNSYLHGQ